MSSEPGNFRIVSRHIGDLWVDPNVQRALKPNHVKTLAAQFDPAALGVLTTSHRTIGRIHIIDGQHRYRAAEAVDYKGPIQTMEYTGLTVPQEAALFRKLNTSDKPSTVDEFLLACVEENPDALLLAKFIKDHGWEVGQSTTDSKLSAVRALQRVFALDPHAVDRALGTVTAAWGRRASAVQGALLEGIGKVYAKHGDDVDFERLVHKLANYPGGPDSFLGIARGQVLTQTGNLSIQVARLTVNLYNARKRVGNLPDWQ